MVSFSVPRTRRVAAWAAGSLVALMLLSVGWSFVEPRLLLVERTTVTSPEVPAGYDGARIVFLSDIHAGTLLGEGHLQRIANTTIAEKPDLIVLGGDYSGGGEGGHEMMRPIARQLAAYRPTIAVLGNHEGGWGSDRSREDLESAGVIVLGNEHVRVRRGGTSILVGGVEDKMTGRPDARVPARDIARSGFSVLVTHNPDVLPDGLADTRGAFDLALAGHTHGGQVTLFGLWAPYLPSDYGQRFRGGWSQIEGVPTLVSRGAGAYILPIRFFAPPQLHVITLRKGPKAVEHETLGLKLQSAWASIGR